jgi:hypothetical protein
MLSGLEIVSPSHLTSDTILLCLEADTQPSNTESHDSTKHYVNGPDAFLNTLLTEYKDAQKRFDEISHRVTKLVTPPVSKLYLHLEIGTRTPGGGFPTLLD